MDTSDSEHFESADEDIYSDEETDQKIQKNFVELPKRSDDKKLETATEEKSSKSSKDEENLPQVTKIENLKIESLEISENEDTVVNKKGTNAVEIEGTIIPVIPDKLNEKKPESTIEDKATSAKKNKPIKSKLGSKIAKDAVHFDSTPKKKVPLVQEIKETEKICEPKDDLWDEDELDWGAEGMIETELRQEDIQDFQQNKTIDSSGSKPYVQNRPETNTSDSWGGWGNWGVSVLSSAGQSVSSITSQLTNVIESSLGAVDPEELAKIDSENKRKLEELMDEKVVKENPEDQSGVFGLGNLVKLVENTGTKVISGGLDTLETIGKKTMEVLQEGDPGLKKKRAFLKIDKDKPVLSQILREAKEKAENSSQTLEEPRKRTKNYLTLLDDFQGLVHLEALELLSKQCEIKLKNIQNSLTGSLHAKFIEKMEQTKELCELIDNEVEEPEQLSKFEEILKDAAAEMEVEITYEKLLKYWEETNIWLDALDVELCDEKELHQKAIETLAQVTSMAMEQFHKFAELALIKDKRRARDEAVNVALIASTLIFLVGLVSDKFVEKLNSKISQCGEKEIREIITNIFYETATTSGNIEDALQLLIPIIQIGEVGSE